MSNLMRYKILYFVLSLLIILPGLYFLFTSGLRLGIDFTGGALLEYQFENRIDLNDLKQQISLQGIEAGQINSSTNNIYIIRTKPVDQSKINQLKQSLNKKFGKVEERRVEFVGPVIGAELSRKAFIAVILASLVIVLYIAFSFRKIPKPASSWRFGITAVVALVHDILVVVGVFAILGKILGVEVDTLFVTALLTVIGFSVHDTIVVFDRIRENLRIGGGDRSQFNALVNASINQTLARSINTSLTLVLTLIALYFLGPANLQYFILIILVGTIVGTYSSIFVASPLLTLWRGKK